MCSSNYQFYDHLLVDSPVSSETALKESSSFKDSLITVAVTAQIQATTLDVTTKTVSDNLEKHQTSTVTPTTTTAITNTVATATTPTMKAAMKTTTSTTTAAITTNTTHDTGSLKRALTTDPFLSRSLMTTGRFGIITQKLAAKNPSVTIEASATSSSQPGKETPEDMVWMHPLTNQSTLSYVVTFEKKLSNIKW